MTGGAVLCASGISETEVPGICPQISDAKERGYQGRDMVTGLTFKRVSQKHKS